jgi:EpsI family protein
MNALKGLAAQVLALALLLQGAAYYVVAAREELVPAVAPLSDFPGVAGGWTLEREYPLEKEVQDVLKADDTLNRLYVNSQRSDAAFLFVAFFKTQRFGQAPHSPKNCLPGSGWQPTEDRKLPISLPGREGSVVVNKYVIERGEQKSLVLYWYQSHKRVIAGELAAKLWLVADAIRYRRSDTALVRVIVPVREGQVAAAEKTAVEFVQSAYPAIARQLPE